MVNVVKLYNPLINHYFERSQTAKYVVISFITEYIKQDKRKQVDLFFCILRVMNYPHQTRNEL